MILWLAASDCQIKSECNEGRDVSCSPLPWLLFLKTWRPRFLFVENNQAPASLSAFVVNDSSGRLTQVTGSPFAHVTTNPTFLSQPVADRNGRFLYVSNYNEGTVYAYSLNQSSGTVSSISGSPYSGFNTPLPVAIDGRSRFVFVSENNASVKAHRIGSDGTLTSYQTVTGGVQPGYPIVDAFDRFVFVGNYNGSNLAYPYKIDQSTGALTAGATAGYNSTTSLMTIEPTGRVLFSVNQAAGAILYSFLIDQTTGGLTTVDQDSVSGGVQGISLPGAAANPGRSVVSTNGRFLYVPNTSNNQRSISAYSIDTSTGILTQIAGSPFGTSGDGVQVPAIHPSGNFMYVANNVSSTIDVFAMNSQTGALSVIAGSPFAAGTGPGAVVVDPGGFFAFVPNYNAGAGNTVSVFSINQTTGAMTQIAGSPYAVGNGPSGATVVSYLVF